MSQINNEVKFNPVMLTNDNAQKTLEMALDFIHSNGAVRGIDLELISYIKNDYPDILKPNEGRLMYLLGLFFKAGEPDDMRSLIYQSFSEVINETIGKGLSPVQASIKNLITNNRYSSFSAPTSIGKSFLFRDLILSEEGDIVFIVPSRALLNEYYLKISEIVQDHVEILVLQFIENVNKAKSKKRIYIVTPERVSDILKYDDNIFNIKLFLLDEAQLSEDSKRGIYFDAIIRRVSKKFPNSRIVFSHPFVSNPSAQLLKHSLQGNSKAFKNQTVGKIFIENKKGVYNYFSPHIKNGHLAKNKRKIENDPVKEILSRGKSILIFTSKNKILNRSFLKEFSEYLSELDTINDKYALELIRKVEDLLAAENKNSLIVELMKKGVLIHHGSIPLQVRYLIEEFANKGYSKICFSTSTLLQGVNLPFNAVWLNGIRFTGLQVEKEIALKNVIGRAGRTSKDKDIFDFGYVIVGNAKDFTQRYNSESMISDKSLLDSENTLGDIVEIEDEFKKSLKENQINDEYDLPKERVERLQQKEINSTIQFILEALFINGKIITQDEYKKLDNSKRESFKEAFKYVFESSLLRKLSKAEEKILSTSVSILLWQIQGKSFKEILKLRYDFVTRKSERVELEKMLKRGEIDQVEFDRKFGELDCRMSPIPQELPDLRLKETTLLSFYKMKVSRFDYDSLVYDTYDYLDKVIGFSLSKIYFAAFSLYYKRTNDSRSLMFSNYFKFGTSDDIEIWLIKYGFLFEDIEWLRGHIDEINADRITFLESIKDLDEDQLMKLNKFL